MINKPRDVTEQDKEIGRRIHQARMVTTLSQTDLAEKVGVCRQQINKYETGEDRVSAGRLKAIASVLNTPIEFFFSNI